MPTRTVLITGCSSGIGRETARAFHREEWRVYATARNAEDVEELAELGCDTYELDVTKETHCRRVVNQMIEDEGRVDCLVNNAGYGQLGPLEDVPTDRVEAQFDVNVFGPHRLIRAVLPHMRDRENGTIVNVSSVIGRISLPGTGVYAGSKFALEAMSDALRPEVAEFGIDVVLVEPGPVETAFSDRIDEEVDDIERTEDAYPGLYRMFEDSDAIGGSGPLAVHPREVASVVLNAASSTDPESRYPVGTFAEWATLLRFVPEDWRDTGYHYLDRFLGSRLFS